HLSPRIPPLSWARKRLFAPPKRAHPWHARPHLLLGRPIRRTRQIRRTCSSTLGQSRGRPLLGPLLRPPRNLTCGVKQKKGRRETVVYPQALPSPADALAVSNSFSTSTNIYITPNERGNKGIQSTD
ncbi:hypothetical protein FRC17_009632, partial [Serendipita sp. 399]